MRNYFFLTVLMVFFLKPVAAQVQTVGIFFNDSLSFNGYTLFAPMNHKHVYLIDNCGYQVHNWFGGSHNNHMAYLLEDGTLLRTGVVQSYHFQAGGRCGIVDSYSWEGDLLWEFEYHSADYHQHHDIEPLPNGNFLMIAWQKYTEQEAIEKGKDPAMLQGELWMDKLLEVDPVSSEIVWEWDSWDHLIQDFDPGKENYGTVADHPGKIDINYTDDPNPNNRKDWMHINSIDYNEELDQILVAVRNYSEIWIIDHSTTTGEAAGSNGGIYGKGGELLYRWGNPEAYGRGGEGDQVLRYMHDPAWIPADYPDGGKILVYNNEHSYRQSSVLVFDPPEDGPGFYTDPDGDSYGPATYDWIYEDEDLYSGSLSGAQRLPNGNTLICEGQGGIFTEVTQGSKERVWKYRSPVNMFGRIPQGSTPQDISQFKIRRYAPDFQGLEGKKLIPGIPVELDPWVYDCTIYGDTLTVISTPGENNPLTVVNPFAETLIVKGVVNENHTVRIFSIQGVLMASTVMENGSAMINTGSWPTGIYILKAWIPGQPPGSWKVVKVE